MNTQHNLIFCILQNIRKQYELHPPYTVYTMAIHNKKTSHIHHVSHTITIILNKTEISNKSQYKKVLSGHTLKSRRKSVCVWHFRYHRELIVLQTFISWAFTIKSFTFTVNERRWVYLSEMMTVHWMNNEHSWKIYQHRAIITCAKGTNW